MRPQNILSIVTNFAFAVYVCGTDKFHGCSTQIVLRDNIYCRRKYGKCFLSEKSFVSLFWKEDVDLQGENKR